MTLFREVGTFVNGDSFGASVRQEDRVRAVEVGYLVEKSGGVVTPAYVLIWRFGVKDHQRERTYDICLSGSRWPYSIWYKMKPLSGWDTWEAIGREVVPDLVIWSGKWERGQGSLEMGEGGKDRRKEECKITRMSKKARRNHAANYLPEKERQLTHVIRCVTIHT